MAKVIGSGGLPFSLTCAVLLIVPVLLLDVTTAHRMTVSINDDFQILLENEILLQVGNWGDAVGAPGVSGPAADATADKPSTDQPPEESENPKPTDAKAAVADKSDSGAFNTDQLGAASEAPLAPPPSPSAGNAPETTTKEKNAAPPEASGHSTISLGELNNIEKQLEAGGAANSPPPQTAATPEDKPSVQDGVGLRKTSQDVDTTANPAAKDKSPSSSVDTPPSAPAAAEADNKASSPAESTDKATSPLGGAEDKTAAPPLETPPVAAIEKSDSPNAVAALPGATASGTENLSTPYEKAPAEEVLPQSSKDPAKEVASPEPASASAAKPEPIKGAEQGSANPIGTQDSQSQAGLEKNVAMHRREASHGPLIVKTVDDQPPPAAPAAPSPSLTKQPNAVATTERKGSLKQVQQTVTLTPPASVGKAPLPTDPSNPNYPMQSSFGRAPESDVPEGCVTCGKKPLQKPVPIKGGELNLPSRPKPQEDAEDLSKMMFCSDMSDHRMCVDLLRMLKCGEFSQNGSPPIEEQSTKFNTMCESMRKIMPDFVKECMDVRSKILSYSKMVENHHKITELKGSSESPDRQQEGTPSKALTHMGCQFQSGGLRYVYDHCPEEVLCQEILVPSFSCQIKSNVRPCSCSTENCFA